ncbi:phosphotransferase [Cellulomonas chitinilytica]|uniref:Phosphotransferase n=1 Tax=Cellulomonas chitinilytica TaxID=398759 RepID=A0A919U1Y2_9CELL|nr:phosphotransferase [Cellulomonas chitinilytica]GIG23678.1 phosphotransferase [Cellulomonas chitinilytica]
MAQAMASPEETPLLGGTSNRGLVFRLEDTVRRPQPPGAHAVHALLEHLERVGFDGAPRYLGLDEQGREVLSYVPGEVPIAPPPRWAWSDDSLASVGALLRRFHDAVESFDAAAHTWPTTVPAAWRGPHVCHNDPNLDNVVFRDGVAVALIDFDLASPGSRLWDLAIAARLWVPLRDSRDARSDLVDRAPARLAVLADGYGLARRELPALVAAARATHDWCYSVVRAGAERGQRGYVEVWTPSKRAYVARGRTWLARHADRLAREVADQR